ncbi:MAG TPA: LysR family transcriptional regulator [Polyangiaceae bacterium]|nr:LysR family transcriptional regulator [Polyangiaceae bacterium]
MRPENSERAPFDGDLADVRAFCAVVRSGSFTAAGRALGERKTQVSRRVARLERALGLPLLRRHARSIELEARAEEIASRLEAALAALDDALDVRAGAAAPWPTLRVTAPADLGAALVAPLLGAWMAATPEARVTLLLSERVEPLAAGGVDCAFRLARRLRDSSLVAHRLAELVAPLFASPAYLAAHGVPRRPEHLASHGVLLLPPARGRLVLRPRRGPGERAVVSVAPRAVADVASLAQMCEAGAGIAAIPTELAAAAQRAGRLVGVLDRFILHEAAGLYLVHRREPPASPRAKALATLKAFAVRHFGGAGVG